MWKHGWLVAALALCVHCGGSTNSAPPAAEPSSAPKAAEPKTAPPAEGKASPSGETDKPSEASSETGSTSESSAPSPPKKKCADYDKAECQIRSGCAWDTVKKCVEYGGGE